MKIEVKNFFNGDVIFDTGYEDLKKAIEKNKFNLSGANLSGADLSHADLSGANLSEIYIHINGSKFDLYCIGSQIQIGCKIHTIAEWEKNGVEIAKNNNFTDNDIQEYKKYIEICKGLNKGK